MNRPKITQEEANKLIVNAPSIIKRSLDQYVADKRISAVEASDYFKIASKTLTGKILVLAVRGYYLNTQGKPGENDRGIYDDAMIVFAPGYYQTFNANTDPRKAEKGIAMLLPGWHLFRQGYHGYGKPAGHKAFRTANEKEVLPVLRDGQTGIKQGVTINLHSGGYKNTNSIGCQTIFKEQWSEFQTTIYDLMNKAAQKTLPYLLIEEKSK